MKKLQQIINKISYFFLNHSIITLLLILCFGIALRSFNLKDNIIVAYDQARDAQRIMEIIQKDFKIVGPETDIPGVFNGPLFYYLLVPLYLISNFDLNFAAFVFILINASGILLIYVASLIIFRKNKSISLFAAFLWAISYEQLNFARFISNASPMSISTILFFLGLLIAIFNGKKIGLTLSVIGLAAAIHFNFYLIYLVIFYPIFFTVFKYKPGIKYVLTNLFLLLLFLSPFAIAEIKWHFMGIKSLFQYVSHQSSGYTSRYEMIASIINNSKRYYDRISEGVGFSIFLFGKLIGFLLLLLLLEFSWKNQKISSDKNRMLFLTIWLFSTLPLFVFKSGVLNGQVINSSIFAPLLIVFASGTYYIFKSKAPRSLPILLVVLFVISNFTSIAADKYQNIKLFATQPLTLVSEKNLIDYTYMSSNRKAFSICGVTNPLFINTLWSFLYSTYGKNKYGYTPAWSGQKQVFNENHLPDDLNRAPVRYLIIEPLGGIPDYAKTATIYLEDRVSQLLEEKKFGDIIIQKRIIPKNKLVLTDTQKLDPEKKKNIEHIVKNIEARYYCYIEY